MPARLIKTANIRVNFFTDMLLTYQVATLGVAKYRPRMNADRTKLKTLQLSPRWIVFCLELLPGTVFCFDLDPRYSAKIRSQCVSLQLRLTSTKRLQVFHAGAGIEEHD